MPESNAKLYRFGVFEADANSGELRKSGVRLRVPEQPFRVLLLLLEKPGEVVTRAELQQRLWPADTFVDFDHSLNTVINKLREALSDSASNPRFIETLAKRGYRFLAPVEAVGVQAARNEISAPEEATGSPSILTGRDELPSVPQVPVRLLFLLIQVMYLSFYLAALTRLTAVEELMDRAFGHTWPTVVLVVSAAVGIPVRLYLLSSVSFNIKNLSRKFLRLFPATIVLDELWALAPFLLTAKIGLGLALGITAALIYVPFAQRTLVLMHEQAGLKAK